MITYIASTTQPHMPSYAIYGQTHQPPNLICPHMPYMVKHINQPSYGPAHQLTFF